MSFLHNKATLDKRRDNALKRRFSLFRGKKSSIFMGSLFIAIGCVLAHSLFFAGVSSVTKEQLEMAVEKAKKDGVFIKNASYKNAENKTEIHAKSAVQTKNKMSLKDVSIGVKDRGQILAEKATVMDDKGIVKATGSVVYTQKDVMEIKGSFVVYDFVNDVLHIKDNVVIEIEE